MLSALLSWPSVAAVFFGYLLGSIPFGLVLTKAAGLGDVRAIGSGNIGATNVLRTGNKGLAAATLVLDALKATVAVWVVYAVLKSRWGIAVDYVPGVRTAAAASNSLASQAFFIAAFAGVAAFVGHIYPVWLGFKGGKGVATFIGAMLGTYWPAALIFCGVWLIVASAFRYSSLAALVASIAACAYPLIIGEYALAIILGLMVLLIFYKHDGNIRRLLAGNEPKIGEKSP